MPEDENISLIGQAKARLKLTDRGVSIDPTVYASIWITLHHRRTVANMPPYAFSEVVGVGCYRKMSCSVSVSRSHINQCFNISLTSKQIFYTTPYVWPFPCDVMYREMLLILNVSDGFCFSKLLRFQIQPALLVSANSDQSNQVNED